MYKRQLLDYGSVFLHEHDWNNYAMVPAYAAKGEMPANLGVPEYDLVQKVRAFSSLLDTFAVLYPQLRDVDLRARAARLQVPVYVVEGEHEARGRAGPSREWFDALEAPTKRWVELPRSGHRPHFEQPARFAATMRAVLSETR